MPGSREGFWPRAGASLALAAAAVALFLPAGPQRTRRALPPLPLVFEPGPEAGSYVARAPGLTLALSAGQAAAALHGKRAAAQFRMRWIGGNAAAAAEPAGRRRGVSNYMLGRDPAGWRLRVPHFGRVRYRDVYPGIDLVFYGNRDSVEHDFVVAPGADPGRIRFTWDGADSIALREGALVLRAGGAELSQAPPVAYQERGGRRAAVRAAYTQTDAGFGFAVGAYDPALPLVIDPVLQASTFTGYDATDVGRGIGLDDAGNIYVAGYTYSLNVPTTPGVLQSSRKNAPDGGILKLSPTGSEVLYATYLGGNSSDYLQGMAVDGAGNAYVTGYTYSNDFPTTEGAPQTKLAKAGYADAFLSKLSPSGDRLVYSTLFGGTGMEIPYGVAVDAAGSAYITGYTTSKDLPTAAALQAENRGGNDVFVAKLNPEGTAFQYATYLGGKGNDYGYAIAVDGEGRAYVTGATYSDDFPLVNPLQAAFGGVADVFAAVVTQDGTWLEASTYYGGASYEGAMGIALDGGNSAYLTGYTRSADFPTTSGAAQAGFRGNRDVFVVKLWPWLSGVAYATLAGGTQRDAGYAIAVDGDGNAYVTGQTESADFPVVSALQERKNGVDAPFFLSDDRGQTWRAAMSLAQTNTVNFLAADPGNPDVLYAAVNGAYGGLFRSTDGGANWAATGFEDATLSAGVLAFDPTNTAVMYAGTGNGIYKSGDGGASWQHLYFTTTIYAILIDPRDSKRIYATVAGQRVMRSLDGGVTWASASVGLGGLSTVYALGMDPANPSILYAGSYGLFKTTDGGTRWVSAGYLSDYINGLAMDPATPRIIYLATDNRGVQVTTDGGVTFSTVLPPIGPVLRVAVDPARPQTVYAAVDVEGLMRSGDQGRTWSRVESLPAGTIQALLLDSRRPERVAAGVAVPTDVFLTKVSADGAAFLYSSYFGGREFEYCYALRLDAARNVYLTGQTYSPDFPVTPWTIPPLGRIRGSAFVARFGELP